MASPRRVRNFGRHLQGNILDRRDFVQYMKTEFPNSYVFYLFLMIITIVTILFSKVTFDPSNPAQIRFEDYFLFVNGIAVATLILYAPYRFITYLRQTKPGQEVRRDTYLIILGISGFALCELLFEIVLDLVTHGAQGLCITRRAPKAVMAEYGLERTPVLWLSRVAAEKNVIRPSPPENVAMAIEHFIEASERPAVLLDGFEYLVSHHDFGSVLALLHDLTESVAHH